MSVSCRFIFVADTHLGFDMPVRPRVRRRRRGPDFFANYELVLGTAVREGVDFVVHGGDLFHRSRVPPSLVQRAFLSLKRVADAGVPVVLVPGNHERSRIPYAGLAEHPRIHIFHRPGTFYLHTRGGRLALAGFPYHRQDVRRAFPDLIRQTGWRPGTSDADLLCVHHCFEGATVGPSDFVFRRAADVVRHRDVPVGFSAVLSGHIHRHQVLTADLEARSIPVPVVYPGSIERTSFAEIDEPKGYLVGEINPAAPSRSVVRWTFRPLPVRPMARTVLNRTSWSPALLTTSVSRVIAEADPDAVVGITVRGAVSPDAARCVSSDHLREMTPDTMNVEVTFEALRSGRRRTGPYRGGNPVPPERDAPPSDQLSWV